MGKPTTSAPDAYRPILLLTAGQTSFEAVTLDGYRILPRTTAYYQTLNSAGARRTTEQALLVLSNAIDRAWNQHKVTLLLSTPGAFNGVNKEALDARLLEPGVSQARPDNGSGAS